MTSLGGSRDRASRATYHPGGSRISPGLERARAPFRTRNAVTGLLIMAFATGVYTYSISAVKQDDFSDLVAPDSVEERRAIKSIEDEERERLAIKKGLRDEFENEMASRSSSRGSDSAPAAQVGGTTDIAANRSLWSRLTGTFGGKGSESALVLGAPDVDRIGRIQDRSSSDAPAAAVPVSGDKRWV